MAITAWHQRRQRGENMAGVYQTQKTEYRTSTQANGEIALLCSRKLAKIVSAVTLFENGRNQATSGGYGVVEGGRHV